MRPMTQAKKTALLYTQKRLKRKHISKTKKRQYFYVSNDANKKNCIFMFFFVRKIFCEKKKMQLFS